MNRESIKSKALLEAVEKGVWIDRNGVVYGVRGRPIKLRKQSSGYYTFSVRFKGKVIPIKVHSLQAFLKYGDEIFNTECIRHLNNTKSDNSWNNIAIGTHEENVMDNPREDVIKRAKYASSFANKYNHGDVVKFYNSCKSYKKTMEEFGISSNGTLHFILKKKS